MGFALILSASSIAPRERDFDRKTPYIGQKKLCTGPEKGELAAESWKPLLSELNIRYLFGGRTGREVGSVLFETGDVCPDIVRELQHEGVVGLEGVVIALAGHADAILSARQLVLQAHELIAGAQLRVVFGEHQEAAQSGIELPVGGNFGLRALRIQHAGSGIGDIAKYGAFFLGETFYGLHEVGIRSARRSICTSTSDHAALTFWSLATI